MKVIYSGILVICASIEFGACFLLSDFREMGVEAKVNIRTSFATLIEEYDPTTGVETLGTVPHHFKSHFKQIFTNGRLTSSNGIFK